MDEHRCHRPRDAALQRRHRGSRSGAGRPRPVDKPCRWIRFEGDALGEHRGLRRPRRRRLPRCSARATGATCSTRRQGFIRPKGADGSWPEPFDPLSAEDFVEANAWQSTWFTSHDVMGLATCSAARRSTPRSSTSRSGAPRTSTFIADYGDGYVSYGNQAGLEMAHLFNYVGYPWLSPALGAAGQGARLQRDLDDRRLRAPRRGPGPDGRARAR